MRRGLVVGVLFTAFVGIAGSLGGQASPQIVPVSYEHQLSAWNRLYIGWSIAHFALGGIATILSVAVATFGDVDIKKRRILSFTAAAAAALLTFLHPQARAHAYHQAFDTLDEAKSHFLASPGDTPLSLHAALVDGRTFIKEAGD